MITSTVSEDWTMRTDNGWNNVLTVLITKTDKYMQIVGYSVCLITNIFGNTLTLISMLRFSFLSDSAYATIKSLSIADLCTNVYIVIILMVNFSFVDVNNAILMSILIGLMGTFVYSATLHVVLVAVDRFVAIVFPYFYSATVTKILLIECLFAHGCCQ